MRAEQLRNRGTGPDYFRVGVTIVKARAFPALTFVLPKVRNIYFKLTRRVMDRFVISSNLTKS